MPKVSKGNTANFLVAYIMSAFGYEFIFFVMTIYVYEVTKNALNIGIFAALTFLPRLFASFYGIIADRYSKARVFAWSASITGLLVLLLVINQNLTWLYLVWSLISVFLTVIINVRTALMTEVMAEDKYLRGNSTVLIALNLAKVCAPLLAGVASTVFGIKSLFYFTGGIYLLVTMFVSRISMPDCVGGQSDRPILAEVKDGLKYMRDSQDLRHLISVSFLWRLFVGLQISLLVVYVKTYLSGSDTDYGIFMTTIGVGSVLGSLAGPWLLKRIQSSAVIFWGMTIHYSCFIILGLTSNFYLALMVIFWGYVVFYTTLVQFHSLRDQNTPAEMRGRVYGSVTAILTPPAIVSMLAGGYMAKVFGVENVFVGAGTLALASFYMLYINRGLQNAKTDRVSS